MGAVALGQGPSPSTRGRVLTELAEEARPTSRRGAERCRRYLVHRRSAFAKWTRRVFGVLGTAVVLALWVVVAGMILPGDDDGR